MKYIIQESKLKSIAKNYLEREIGDFEWAIPSKRELGYVGVYYKDGDRTIIVMTHGVSISRKIYMQIKKLFSLTDKELTEIINEVIDKRLGVKVKRFVDLEYEL